LRQLWDVKAPRGRERLLGYLLAALRVGSGEVGCSQLGLADFLHRVRGGCAWGGSPLERIEHLRGACDSRMFCRDHAPPPGHTAMRLIDLSHDACQATARENVQSDSRPRVRLQYREFAVECSLVAQ